MCFRCISKRFKALSLIYSISIIFIKQIEIMEKLTYDEAIYHIRKYKNLYRVGSIAEMIGINQGQLRQVVNRVGYAKELPQRYRDDFVNVVSMLVSVEQIDEARKELERFYS